MRGLGLWLLVMGSLSVAGCEDEPAQGQSSPAAAMSAETPMSVVSTSPATAPSPPPARAASASAAPSPSAGLAPLPDDCADPRVLLEVAPSSDRAPVARLRAVLAAHPGLIAQDGPPRAPGQLLVESATFGSKSFEHPETNKTALLVRCFDGATCRTLAALYGAEGPARAAPTLVCGPPRAISGQLAAVPGPWLK